MTLERKIRLAVIIITFWVVFLGLFFLPTLCEAGVRWANNGVPLCAAAGNQDDPRTISDGSHGAIVVWTDSRSGNNDIYAQRVSSNGAPLWKADGIAVCAAAYNQDTPRIFTDGAGGAIIVWQDKRSNSTYDLYAQRLSPSGTAQWTTNGLLVSGAATDQLRPMITTDGASGAIIAWDDSRNGDNDIYAQRISAGGVPQWTAGGVPVSLVAGSSQEYTRIISDDAGGAIITWQDYRNGTTMDLYAQRIDSNGATQWTGNGVPICTATNHQYAALMAPDGNSGAFLAWSDFRSGSNYDIYAQRINSSGTPQWANSGIAISSGVGDQRSPGLIADGSGDAIVVWQDSRADAATPTYDVYAQKVDKAGVSHWTPNGLAICVKAGDQYAPVPITDCAGGAIIEWLDSRAGNYDVYAQRVSAGGLVLWTTNGSALCTAPGDQGQSSSYFRIASDGVGGAIVAWKDARAGTSNTDIYAQRISDPGPTPTAITPAQGVNTGTVTITDLAGAWFKSPATVKLRKSGRPDISATSVKVVSSNKITCKFNIAGAPTGAWNVVVTNTIDGQSATKANTFTIASPRDYPIWYLAEGSTAYGFQTHICVQNPNTSGVHADITYMTTSGPVSGGTVALPAKSQATIYPTEKLGSKDFSTKVLCEEGKTICVDRTMAWPAGEAHASVGVTSPANTWYLAEGSSRWGFESWLLVQNPNGKTANCSLTYMIEGSSPKTVKHQIPPNSRASFSMASDIGAQDASIKVNSDIPVITERAMYRNNRREGHDSIGTTAPNTNYYLAEGCTGYGYTTYVLIQNPNNSAVNVDITYMTGAGPVPMPTFKMAANSRRTINVNTTASLPNPNFSTKVHGSGPLIAERAMYWNSGTGEACHDTIGLDSPHTTFYFPDGDTSRGWVTYILLQNPNESDVSVEVTYMTPDGKGDTTCFGIIPANSRITFLMSDKIPSGRAAIMVTSKTSGEKIMAERSMYFNNRQAGTDTIGGYSDP